MDAVTWLERFATAAGTVALTAEQTEAILELAGVAAHASERLAAPLTCWIAATAGLDPATALEIARALEGGAETDRDGGR